MASGTLRVQRHEGPDLAWTSWAVPLDPRLRGLVRRATGFEELPRSTQHRTEAAASGTTLVLTWGAPYAVGAAGTPLQTLDGGFVAGPSDGPTLTRGSGPVRGVQVDLTPAGASRLLGLPVAELTGRAVALQDVWGRHGQDLPERVQAAGPWPLRLDAVQDVLLARLAQAPPLPPVVRAALRMLGQGDGVRIGEVARRSGCSRSHVHRAVTRHVGLAPAVLARVVRFERAVAALRASRGDPGAFGWAGFAVRQGYCDQAHLAREVRRLAGTPPTALAASLGATSVQDVGDPVP
jgi:AraC-like DNA-binding protein